MDIDSLFLLLQEAPVSWKTLQKGFVAKYGAEGLDNIAKSLGFNNFQEFYQDVYNTLRKDEGGRVYEPNFTELNKIFKFLLEDPEIYQKFKDKLRFYGYYRYLGSELDILNQLIAIKDVKSFKEFLENLENPFSGDLAIDYSKYNKVYSDSNFDIYKISNYNQIRPLCDGTTWCVKEESFYKDYNKTSTFYIAVSKKEWFEQKNFIRKKYSILLPNNIETKGNKVIKSLQKLLKMSDKEFENFILDQIDISFFERLLVYDTADSNDKEEEKKTTRSS